MDVRRPTLACSLLLILMLLALARSANAAQYYVATNGSDNNPGTAALPWGTLQFAADEVAAGDRVTVRPGNYAGFELSTDGEADNRIEFFAEPGVHVTSGVPGRGDGINLEGASFITIDGFNVANMPHAGVRSVGFEDEFATGVIVRNVTAANNHMWGIFTGHVNNLLIENNFTSGSQVEHGIYVSNSGDNPTIRNNVIWGNNGSGIHMNGDLSAGGDGVISGAHVYGNIIYDNGLTGSGINMDGIQDSVIENNLIYNNHSSGISLYRIDGGEPATNNIIANNTIQIAEDGRWAINIQNGSTGNDLRNNILLTDHPSRGAIDISANSQPGFTSDYNIIGPPDDDEQGPPFSQGGTFRTLVAWRTQTGNDLNTIIADYDELFVDFANADFQLSATSPARNTGTSQFAPNIDLTGKLRPIGGAYDIGAYEFGFADALAADYNGDGAVDAADYTVWRNTLGNEGDNLPADGDGDGAVAAGDYTIWKNHYGESLAPSGGGLAVPEPSLLGTVCALALTFVSRVAAPCASRERKLTQSMS